MPSVRDEKAAGALGQARSQDLYASGMDGAAVRLQVRLAAARRWKAGTLDIKTAFLAAPLFQQQGLSSKATKKLESKAIIVTPPKILSSLGIIEPGEKWLVLKALYGLAEAPAAWATERDLQLSRMKWTDEHGSMFCLQTVPNRRKTFGKSYVGTPRGIEMWQALQAFTWMISCSRAKVKL